MFESTTIQNAFRKDNSLTFNEYALIDTIYRLATLPDNPVPGWCFASRETLGLEMALSKQSIINLVDKLITAGFLEKNVHTKNLKTSKLWNDHYFVAGKESLPPVKKVYQEPEKDGKESLPAVKKVDQEIGKESLPYIIHNTVNTNTDTLFLEKKSETELKFEKFVAWLSKNAPNVLKMKEPVTIEQYGKLRKEYEHYEMELTETFLAMHNTVGIKKYTSAYLTARNWVKRRISDPIVVPISKPSNKKAGVISSSGQAPLPQIKSN